jgi:hypothetical protein
MDKRRAQGTGQSDFGPLRAQGSGLRAQSSGKWLRTQRSGVETKTFFQCNGSVIKYMPELVPDKQLICKCT